MVVVCLRVRVCTEIRICRCPGLFVREDIGTNSLEIIVGVPETRVDKVARFVLEVLGCINIRHAMHTRNRAHDARVICHRCAHLDAEADGKKSFENVFLDPCKSTFKHSRTFTELIKSLSACSRSAISFGCSIDLGMSNTRPDPPLLHHCVSHGVRSNHGTAQLDK